MRCWWSTRRLTALGWLLAAMPASAQSPIGDAAAAALRAPPDGPAGILLRDGFATLARGTQTHERPDLDRALALFDEATRRAADSPAPWYGRALTKLELGHDGFVVKEGAGQSLGERPYQAFSADIDRALARDPDYVPLLRFLRDALVLQGDRTQPPAFVHAIEQLVALGDSDPRSHLVLGRAYRTAADDGAAAREFAAYARAGGDQGTAALETARALAGAGRLDSAAAHYRDGWRFMTAEARAIYREDLAWIASPAELRAFDSLPVTAAGRWIDRLWSRRDAEELRAPGERLREHLRRWAYAYRNFRVVHPERRVDQRRVFVDDISPRGCSDSEEKSLDDYPLPHPDRRDDYRARERLLDDRAVIYLRHGEPWRRMSGAAVEARRRTTEPASADGASTGSGLAADIWLYWFKDRPRVVFLAGSGALGPGPTTVYTHLPLESDLLYHLSEVDPIFTKAANRIALTEIMSSRAVPLSCQLPIRDFVVHTRADVTAAAQSDSHTLLFHHSLAPIIQMWMVGQPRDGTSRVLIAYAVPGERLATRTAVAGPGAVYALALRASAVDTLAGTVRRLDTTRTVHVADTMRTGSYLSGIAELPVPDGRYAVRVVVFQPEHDAGTTVVRYDARITDTSPGLSDLILERETGGLRWDNRGDPVSINTLGAYPEGATAPLYYEVYGLERGEPFRTTISVHPRTKPTARGVTLSFTEQATGPEMHVRRSIDLTPLKRGQYVLTVTVQQAADGRRATRSQLLNVTEP